MALRASAYRWRASHFLKWNPGEALRRHERVSRTKLAESAEVSIGTPELLDAVMNAQRRDARIMYARAVDLGSLQQTSQHSPVALTLGEHHERRGFKPCCHLLQSPGKRRWRREDALVRHDGQKLVYAWPWQRP